MTSTPPNENIDPTEDGLNDTGSAPEYLDDGPASRDISEVEDDEEDAAK